MKKVIVSLAVALTLGACSASNQYAQVEPAADVDQFGFDSIVQGDWARAETSLASAETNDPFRLLNLAYVYKETGRTAEAAALYNKVLELEENPYAKLSNGDPARVKTIAKKALKAMEDGSN